MLKFLLLGSLFKSIVATPEPLVWLDATNGVVKTDQLDRVITWNDKSGNYNDAKGSGASSPVLKVDYKWVYPIKYVSFDGVDDMLQGTSALYTRGTMTVVAMMKAGHGYGSDKGFLSLLDASEGIADNQTQKGFSFDESLSYNSGQGNPGSSPLSNAGAADKLLIPLTSWTVVMFRVYEVGPSTWAVDVGVNLQPPVTATSDNVKFLPNDGGYVLGARFNGNSFNRFGGFDLAELRLFTEKLSAEDYKEVFQDMHGSARGDAVLEDLSRGVGKLYVTILIACGAVVLLCLLAVGSLTYKIRRRKMERLQAQEKKAAESGELVGLTTAI